MKLIIDIDDELVELARFAVRMDMGVDYVKSIANGIPLDDVLDKIRAEIEEIETYDGLYIDRAYVFQIIDKYRKGANEYV